MNAYKGMSRSDANLLALALALPVAAALGGLVLLAAGISWLCSLGHAKPAAPDGRPRVTGGDVRDAFTVRSSRA